MRELRENPLLPELKPVGRFHFIGRVFFAGVWQPKRGREVTGEAPFRVLRSSPAPSLHLTRNESKQPPFDDPLRVH